MCFVVVKLVFNKAVVQKEIAILEVFAIAILCCFSCFFKTRCL